MSPYDEILCTMGVFQKGGERTGTLFTSLYSLYSLMYCCQKSLVGGKQSMMPVT